MIANRPGWHIKYRLWMLCAWLYPAVISIMAKEPACHGDQLLEGKMDWCFDAFKCCLWRFNSFYKFAVGLLKASDCIVKNLTSSFGQ